MFGAADSMLKAHRHVDRFVSHGAPLSFRELCAEVLSPDTRYLVLDLDGTVHLKRNLGELFGWELGATKSYGSQAIERLEPTRRNARWLLNWAEPGRVADYILHAIRWWAVPGAHYLVWGKGAQRSRWVRRLGFRRFHADPIRAVQPRIQHTLMEELATVSATVLPSVMERVWQRHRGDQVIDAADIRWLRETHPAIQIVLSSASPEPVVEFAAARLGIEHAHYSTPDRINSGEAKIELLRETFADIGDSGVEVVGMTDTAHGEDHCWARHFTKVVDINSPAPFPPLVPMHSPLVEIHSAVVLSGNEARERIQKPAYLDPRRRRTTGRRRRELGSADLAARVGDLVDQFNGLILSAARLADPDDLAYRLAMLSESSRARLA